MISVFKHNFTSRVHYDHFSPSQLLDEHEPLVARIQTWPWYAVLTILSSLIPHVLLSTFLQPANIWIIWYMIKNAFPAVLYQLVVADGAFLYCFSISVWEYLHSPSYLFGAVPNSTGCSTVGRWRGKGKWREGDCCWLSRACNITLN